MKTVSRFEANLLRILHGFFGRVSSDQVLKLVQTEMDCPKCLSRNAVELVKDTLQKGVPMYLAQHGGWRRERFLRNEQIAEGRLWNRTPPDRLGLAFSEHSLRFLIWITANHPNRSQQKFVPEESQLTTGDRLLYFLAYESLRGTEPVRGLLEQPPFQNHALLWLVYLSDLVDAKVLRDWDFSPWMEDQGASILESLQPLLVSRWFQMERQKIRIQQPKAMRRLGDLQNQILTNLFDAAESSNRQDLCRFFLIAMQEYLREINTVAGANRTAPLYHLDMSNLRIADRAEVYQSAAACLRQMARMDRWNRVARGIGFYEEGYSAAQLWKADWEQLEGDRLCAESQARINALEPLGVGGGSSPTSPRKNRENQADTSHSN